MRKKIYLAILLFLYFFCTNILANTKINAKIEIYSKNGVKANKLVFGSSIIGWLKSHGKTCKTDPIIGGDYGYGVWDPKWNDMTMGTQSLCKTAGLTNFRFIGMFHNWQEGVRIPGQDRRFKFGIDEQMAICSLMCAEPIICIQYIFDNARESIALIQYLNAKADDGLIDVLSKEENNDSTSIRKQLFLKYVNKKTGELNWANLRAINGRVEPYGIRYVEIGNETGQIVSPEEYAEIYLTYYKKIKDVDPEIKVGVVLFPNWRAWNIRVLNIIKERVDFGTVHYYPSPIWEKNFSEMLPKDIYSITLAQPILDIESNIRYILKLFKKYSGKILPLAVTEYNGGFVQDKPVPYRHCLGTALLNAEMLKLFMEPKNNILVANYWNFCNEYWGMIANKFDGTYETLNRPYYKRPNYYVFEMYNSHFSDILIEVKLHCKTYDIKKYPGFIASLIETIRNDMVAKDNLLKGEWRNHNFNGALAKEKNNILEIYFTNPKKFNYYHSSKTANIEPNTYYKLSGYIKLDDFIDKQGVCLLIQDGRGWNVTHSAKTTEKLTGTMDWTYIETIYKTLPDAKSIDVIARRVGDKGPLHGKAYFKEVKLEKIITELNTKIPYLSANASTNEDKNKVYLMVINKNLEASETATIDLKDFIPAGNIDAWVLNGPKIDSTNEENPNTVKVVHKSYPIKGNPFEFTFEPHSLTAIEITRAKNGN